MKQLIHGVAAASLAIAALAALPVEAATTSAVGPYYATPSWDQKLPPATRFVVLANWNNEAVLDRETGLVWTMSLTGRYYTTGELGVACATSTTGGRMGWRMPTIHELARTLYMGPDAPMTADSPLYFTWIALIDTSDSGWRGYIDSAGIFQVSRPQASGLTDPSVGIGPQHRTWCVQSPAAQSAWP